MKKIGSIWCECATWYSNTKFTLIMHRSGHAQFLYAWVLFGSASHCVWTISHNFTTIYILCISLNLHCVIFRTIFLKNYLCSSLYLFGKLPRPFHEMIFLFPQFNKCVNDLKWHQKTSKQRDIWFKLLSIFFLME